jgi:hypothetical protein
MKSFARYLLLFTLYFTAVEICIAQVYIGKHKDEVRQLMKENRKDLSLDESSRNTVYNLLKYVDRNESQTLLFVFNENDTCQYYKLTCDYSLLKKIQRDLDEKYTRSEEGLWYFTAEGKKFQVTLKQEEWFFSVLTKEVKQMNN